MDGLNITCCECNSMTALKCRTRENLIKMESNSYICRSCRQRGDRAHGIAKLTRDGIYWTDLRKKERSLKMMGQNNHFYGRNHSEETKNKIRQAQPDQTGENNPFFGKTHSEKTRKHLSISNKKVWENYTDAETESLKLKLKDGHKRFANANPEKLSEMRKKAARASHITQFNNFKMNKVENLVYQELICRNLDEQFQYSVILGGKQYDFGCKEKRILLEVHGDYWHANPKIYATESLNNTQISKKRADSEKYNFAVKHGFKIFYIWESEVKSGDFTTIDRIQDVLLSMEKGNTSFQ